MTILAIITCIFLYASGFLAGWRYGGDHARLRQKPRCDECHNWMIAIHAKEKELRLLKENKGE
jgi:hypothetical protein